ncbi:protein KHNYN [Denticeps clupeoides]|uniref:protein KHNYN n=1 Tax=Denticeps clupeoides TaxID=299321 RepID=UPI0010A2B3CA|nr:protein KHNYN-like [Denticeps clupeoides]
MAENEFACAAALRDSALSLQPTVRRVFGVALAVDEGTGDAQIWLQLRGRDADVGAATLYVKGVVNQEEQHEMPYPEVLHCVFAGARGLFMDCLIKITSAHITVGSPGFLLISGLAEPVVQAYSLIMDLVERFEASQKKHNEAALSATAESLDSRRSFKALVEHWEDRHTLNLLVLPASVKEALLELVKESGLENRRNSSGRGEFNENQDKTEADLMHPELRRLSMRDHKDPRTPDALLEVNGPSLGNRGIEDEDPDSSAQGFMGEESEGDKTDAPEAWEEEVDECMRTPGAQDDFKLLLEFFTAMGYDEDAVLRVLSRVRTREAYEILELVEKEQSSAGSQTPPSEERGLARQSTGSEVDNGRTGSEEKDFVLGVVERAAATCGYTEEQVREVYSNLPELSFHQLIVELQGQDSRGSENPKSKGSSSSDARKRKKAKQRLEEDSAGRRQEVVETVKDVVDNLGSCFIEHMELERNIIAAAYTDKPKGRPTKPELVRIQQKVTQGAKASSQSHPGSSGGAGRNTQTLPGSGQAQSHRQDSRTPVRGPPQATYPVSEGPSTGRGQRRPFRPLPAASSITGAQRFVEGLQVPFELKLTDDPGDPGLRQVIIDASNVAMSHGLGHFFSCRGIALAVQYFWNRGHRKIAALVPQWREKKDPKNKEQHYITQLKDLGLLSFTPSREVMGKRINAYDDRIMLQLAQRTDGVIVTNDNLRDLIDECDEWKDIIKTRLLQYTFVGDLFMVPDDPLGRSGPHLDIFLHAQRRASPAASQASLGHPAAPRAHTAERGVAESSRLKRGLLQVFPGQESVVMLALQCNPTATDVGQLSNYILELQGSDGSL